MKIRGNKGDAESPNFASYFLITLPIAKVIAQKINKNLKIEINFLTIASSFAIIAHFTTITYKFFNVNIKFNYAYL